jgi:hypothetical protein
VVDYRIVYGRVMSVAIEGLITGVAICRTHYAREYGCDLKD